MSTRTSPKPALESLQKRLASLHKRRYNLDVDFISIRQNVGVLIEQHRLTSARIFQKLLWRRDLSYFRQYCASMMWFRTQAIDVRIVRGRSNLEKMERSMCRKMKRLRELSEISFEIEEEIREVESEVMVGMADMWLEETRTLRNCRLPLSVDWW